ncbi:MAG: CehA/McbA family metallohydrolase [Verrucomicrobiae bacterium]|nr:CehA/McbA family metallohydrolase [Verrucomicrobiae bacterium]
MMNENPFQAEGQWLKGNTHTHTTVSDGDLSPKDMVEKYREAGYDFVFITDHDRLTDVSGLSSGSCLALPGEEVTCDRVKTGGLYHIVALDIKREIPLAHARKAQDVLDEIRAQGGEAIIAHPHWSGMVPEDITRLNGYIGLEVFNTSCHYCIGKGHSSGYWDQLLLLGKNLLGFAADDAHYHFNDLRPNDACGSWIMVKSKARTKEAIMEAIKKGLFYSSNGPAIERIEIRDQTVFADTSPSKIINVIANGPKGRSYTAKKGGALTHVEYKISDEKYIRVECHDGQGGTAWSNTVVMKEPFS